MDTPQPAERAPRRDRAHRMPRWVKGFIIAAVAAVVLVVIVLAIGSGGHGPSRHLPYGVQSTTPTPTVHTPPVDHG